MCDSHSRSAVAELDSHELFCHWLLVICYWLFVIGWSSPIGIKTNQPSRISHQPSPSKIGENPVKSYNYSRVNAPVFSSILYLYKRMMLPVKDIILRLNDFTPEQMRLFDESVKRG
jgi:hypothetical protein